MGAPMSTLKTVVSAMANTIYDSINVAEAPDQLDQLARVIWRGYSERAIDDDDAQFLQFCIDAADR